MYSLPAALPEGGNTVTVPFHHCSYPHSHIFPAPDGSNVSCLLPRLRRNAARKASRVDAPQREAATQLPSELATCWGSLRSCLRPTKGVVDGAQYGACWCWCLCCAADGGGKGICRAMYVLVFIVMGMLRYYDITVSSWRPTCCYYVS